jgi:hypothetical protein
MLKNVYLVRCSFKNKFGSEFFWDFQMETEDYAEAIDEAVLTFWSGLTFEERWDAAHNLDVVAHPNFLPPTKRKEDGK